jgi:hypothetical protein
MEKEKVSDTGPEKVFVATKMWKPALLSPRPGSVITIDTPVVVFFRGGKKNITRYVLDSFKRCRHELSSLQYAGV